MQSQCNRNGFWQFCIFSFRHGRSMYVLTIFLVFLLQKSNAWKPIAGQAQISVADTSAAAPSAAAAYSTTSFSLKQSHPNVETGAAQALKAPAENYATPYRRTKSSHQNPAIITSNILKETYQPQDLHYPLESAFSAAQLSAVSEENYYDSYSLEDTGIQSKAHPLPQHTTGTTLTKPQISSGGIRQAHFTDNNNFGVAAGFGASSCSAKKFAFNQDGIVQYKNELPELNQFTMCLWMRFTNHTGDHVILTYLVEKEPREIQIWVANANNSSFISMAIKGQQMYRLNYPLRMRQWHHMCTSWNGKTGEWQVWLKAERIGRGFHNSLVGHKVPANGKLYSGGPSVTGQVSHGLHFEVTFVQIYRVALSAGKAHRDHKHHHVHHFDHEGQEVATTTRAPPPVNRPLPMHNLLASGQIPTRVRINLASPQLQQAAAQSPNGLASGSSSPKQAFTIHTNFVNGQINSGSRLVAQQLLGLPANFNSLTPGSVPAQPIPQFNMLSNSANVQFVDETETHLQFKRNAKDDESVKNAEKTNSKGGSNVEESDDKNVKKRGLLLLNDGSIIDDGLGSDGTEGTGYTYEGLTEFGGKQFKDGLNLKMNIDEEVSTHDREPAEEEVKAVMALCSICDPEPFQGAIVMAWKDVFEYMDNALKGLSVGSCGNF